MENRREIEERAEYYAAHMTYYESFIEDFQDVRSSLKSILGLQMVGQPSLTSIALKEFVSIQEVIRDMLKRYRNTDHSTGKEIARKLEIATPELLEARNLGCTALIESAYNDVLRIETEIITIRATCHAGLKSLMLFLGAIDELEAELVAADKQRAWDLNGRIKMLCGGAGVADKTFRKLLS